MGDGQWEGTASFTDSAHARVALGPLVRLPAPPQAEGVETPPGSHQPGPRPHANSNCPPWG